MENDVVFRTAVPESKPEPEAKVKEKDTESKNTSVATTEEVETPIALYEQLKRP
jgi:hypothetical protein